MIVEDFAEEISQESGFEGFSLTIDKKDANRLTTTHNKFINTHTEDLRQWWKIFTLSGKIKPGVTRFTNFQNKLLLVEIQE